MQASCQCGSLTATIADNAKALTVLCHCTTCQKRSGSPFGVMAYFAHADVSLSGEATRFTRVSDAGNEYTTGFCPQCGSTVFSLPGKHPRLTGIPIGAIADPHFPMPVRSVYEQDRHDWVTLPDAITGYAQGRDT